MGEFGHVQIYQCASSDKLTVYLQRLYLNLLNFVNMESILSIVNFSFS